MAERVGGKDGEPTGWQFKETMVCWGATTGSEEENEDVPPTSYVDAYNQAMDLESEQKTSKKKHKSLDSDDSSSESSSSDEESSKKVRAL